MGKSSYTGVRYRESKTRKHGLRADRAFFIRYRDVTGRLVEEAAGWASEGMTAAKAAEIRGRIVSALRTGQGPASLAEMRAMAEAEGAQAIQTARHKARAGQSLSDFWAADYLPMAHRAKSLGCVSTEEGLWRKWIAPALGQVRLTDLTPVMITGVMDQARRAGRSAATCRYICAVVSQVWEYARTSGLVTGDSPTRLVHKPRADNRRVRYLTPSEAKRLLEALALRSTDVHDAALLSLFAGLRAGECWGLTWADVDFESGALYIRDAKNGMSRHAILTPALADMLHERSLLMPGQHGFILPARGGSRRTATPDTFARTVEALGFNLGITDSRQKVVFHTLRHTFASWLVQRGTPLYTVAELMGHKDIAMTRRYAHLAPDTMRAAAMGLAGILDDKTRIIPFRRVVGGDK